MTRATVVLLGLALFGCAEAGQEHVALPLYLAGSDLSEPLPAAGGIPLHVDRAQLAFGPLYLCAGNTAGELCETARLQWLGTHVIDLTRAEPELGGELSGVSGAVLSWMYDLGISSQLTRDQPFVLEAARALDGNSLRIEGSAELQGVSVPFQAALAIEQSQQTEAGVPVIRKSISEDFAHTVTQDESGLLVRFDAAAWLRNIDLRGYLQARPCASGGPERVCSGTQELSCAADGTTESSRDCAALGQACLHGLGCTQLLRFEQGSEPYRALRDALLVGKRPSFEWGFEP